MKTYEGVEVSLTNPDLWNKMMNGQLHAMAALLLGKEPSVHIGQDVGWAPGPVWTLWSTEKCIAPAGNWTPVVQPVAILTEIIQRGPWVKWLGREPGHSPTASAELRLRNYTSAPHMPSWLGDYEGEWLVSCNGQYFHSLTAHGFKFYFVSPTRNLSNLQL
jgi:hypothetical protein